MTEAERRYEALAERMEEMKREMIALSDEVHRARTPATEPDATNRVEGALALVDKSGARALKARAEAQLDDLARSMQEPGESFAKAYTRAIETDLGRSMLRTLDDATRLAQGDPTEAMVAEHRKSLA
jgi:type II secretory pathway component PulJ